MYNIQEIKEIPIDQVISDFGIRLRKVSEDEMSALCPFHEESQPSFRVNLEKNVFHCFGCNAGGDVISFVQKFKDISFGEAIRYLRKKYNVKYSFSNLGKIREKENYRKEILLLEEKVHDVLDTIWDNEWSCVKPFYETLKEVEKSGDETLVFECLEPICDFDIFENRFWLLSYYYVDPFFRKVRSDREGLSQARTFYKNFLNRRRK